MHKSKIRLQCAAYISLLHFRFNFALALITINSIAKRILRWNKNKLTEQPKKNSLFHFKKKWLCWLCTVNHTRNENSIIVMCIALMFGRKNDRFTKKTLWINLLAFKKKFFFFSFFSCFSLFFLLFMNIVQWLYCIVFGPSAPSVKVREKNLLIEVLSFVRYNVHLPMIPVMVFRPVFVQCANPNALNRPFCAIVVDIVSSTFFLCHPIFFSLSSFQKKVDFFINFMGNGKNLILIL